MAETLNLKLDVFDFTIPGWRKKTREITAFQKRHYRGVEWFAPKLGMEYHGLNLPGLKTVGLMTPEHPYHASADTVHCIARDSSGRARGTISVSVNHRFNEYHGCQVASFGFFETPDDPTVSATLFDFAADWARSRGMKILRGPGSYSNATHDVQGFLMDHYADWPTPELTWNYDYYPRLAEDYGFKKAKDYYTYELNVHAPWSDRHRKLLDKIQKRGNFEIRPIDLKNVHRDAHIVRQIYNEAWKDNWGFLPLTEAETDILAEALLMIADPGLVLFAFKDGKPIAVFGCLGDVNEILRNRRRPWLNNDWVRLARMLTGKKKVQRLRLMFFGILPAFRSQGVDVLLYARAKEYAMGSGSYRRVEMSLLLEENILVQRACEFMGGHKVKTYRLYDLEL